MGFSSLFNDIFDTTTTSRPPVTKPYQRIPALETYHFEFEKRFTATEWMKFAYRTWPTLPLALVVVYLLMIIAVPRFMRDRKPYNLRTALALWNLSLSLFSFCGMVRTVPHLLYTISTKSFRDIICDDPEASYGGGAVGLWVTVFILSKILELGDTAFIVFRKSVS